MPLTKRRSTLTRPNILISPSAPSLPLRPTTKPYPPTSFGRRPRDWRRNVKGKERVMDHASQSGATVDMGFNKKEERAGMVNADLSDEDPSIDALIDIIVQADKGPSDFPPARPFVSASTSNHSRSLSVSTSHHSSTAHLSRTLSLHSTATTQASSEDRPLLPLPPLPSSPIPVVHRKLVKRRPSSTSPSLISGSSRPWRSAVALPLTETSPTYLGNSIPLPSTSFVALREPSSIPALPEGAEPPVIVHTFSSTSLSRNGSSSTTASSLLPTSEESTGLATPHTEMVELNRDTFGPSWDNLVSEDEDHLRASSSSTDGRTGDEDDFQLPRFPSSEGHDNDSIGQSSKTSSSAHTTRPRTQMSTSTFEIPHTTFHMESVRDREYSLNHNDTRAGQDLGTAAVRVPSIYDLGEILRSGTGDMGSIRSRRTGRYRSASVGGLSMAETSCSMDEILSGGPVNVARSTTLPAATVYNLIIQPADNSPSISSNEDILRRRAPAPPHLLRPTAGSPQRDSVTYDSGLENHAESSRPQRPAIPDRTTSLGLLWRRMSGRGPTRSASDRTTSEEGSDVETRKKDKRPGLIRALSRRKTTISAVDPPDIVEDVPPVPALPAGHSGPSSRPAQDARSDEAQTGCPVNTSQSPNQRNGIPFPELPTQTVSISVDIASTAPDENPTPPSPPTRIPHRASSLPIRPDRILLNRVPPLQTILKDSFASIPEANADGITGTLILSSPTETIPPDQSMESGVERKRRFRRTLVEVEDDHEFQKLLQGVDGLGTLDTPTLGNPSSTEACCGHAATVEVDGRIGGDREGSFDDGTEESGAVEVLESSFMLIGPLPVEMEKHTIQAWFVMRELVQGEKRHGRLLARGVSIARSFAERAGMALHGVPDLAISTSSSPNTSPFKRLSRLSRPASTSRRPRSMHVNSASTLTLPLSTYSSASVLHLEPKEDLSPLEILLHRLPRLLALSLTLSSRFAHDPSPDQVATAFLSMEVDLLLELGEWAGEVGQLIAMGFGEQLDEELRGDAEIRRSSTSDLASLGLLSMSTSSSGTETPQNEGRMSFSEVLLGPIQRAARYRLLFHSLANKMPDGSKGKEKVQAALYAAERLVDGVNKGQDFDLDGLRRAGRGEAGGEDGEGEGLVVKRKKGKSGRRVRSMYASA